MANRTAKDAKSIKGTNPQFLIEKIIRSRIYDCKYWKEECFALTSELLVDKAMELDHVGGVYGGNIQPSNFLCLVLKMLQIQPSKDIVIEFIKNPDYKYVRALGATYLRLVGDSVECYNYLEPLYNDYRKLKKKNRNGEFELVHIDEYVDTLLHEERVCDVILPRIQKRGILEELEQLEPRISALEEDLSDVESEEEEVEVQRSPSPPPPVMSRGSGRHRSRSPPHHRRRSRSPRERSPQRNSRRRRSHSRSPRRHRHRSPSPSHRHRRRSRSRSVSPRHSRSEREHKGSSKSDKREKKSSKKLSAEDEEIRLANEQRAKLGLKPLRID